VVDPGLFSLDAANARLDAVLVRVYFGFVFGLGWFKLKAL
jgi:hypothetical protein